MKSYVFLWDSDDFCLQIIYVSNHLVFFFPLILYDFINNVDMRDSVLSVVGP